MKKLILSIIMVPALFVSCTTDFGKNEDPDLLTPDQASFNAQLPAGIVGLAGSEGAGMAIFGGFWAQYWTQSNTANQFKDIDNYSAGTADYNFIWNGMFDALGDIRNVKRRAYAEGNWKYYLIATTLEAQASQILTDMYGSIPYKEAGYSTILQPHFNTGEEVYGFMIEDLNDALSKDLSTSSGLVPANDDLVFRGDMDKWTAFANTMKLKIFMRQTNSSRAAIANAGITALLASGVDFLDEDAGMITDAAGAPIFVDSPNLRNPLYEYTVKALNVATNLRKSTTLSSFLADNADPRLGEYYDAGNALNQGDFNSTASNIATIKLDYDTPVYFMTKEESLLLQAEALERYSGGAGAQALYEEAITTNFSRYGLDATPFISGAYAYPATNFDDKLEAIITQKWIASFPGNGFEAFFEKNRTDFPRTSAVPQSNAAYVPGQFAISVTTTQGANLPKRIVYPLSERNTNPNTPALVPITTPVWWD
ncbi:SusD/RagB family nutrient-binding outer membrane lipoprotein [Flavobacterium sp.]